MTTPLLTEVFKISEADDNVIDMEKFRGRKKLKVGLGPNAQWDSEAFKQLLSWMGEVGNEQELANRLSQEWDNKFSSGTPAEFSIDAKEVLDLINAMETFKDYTDQEEAKAIDGMLKQLKGA